MPLDAALDRPAARTAGARCACGDDPSVLARVLEDGVDLAVWTRPVPPLLAARASRARARDLPDLRLPVPAADADRVLAQALADLPDRALAAALAEDAAALVRTAAPLVGRDELSVRLETVTGDACRRFHADRVRLRLIATYRGPGTEWVDEDALPPGGDPRDPPPHAVRRLPAGAVGVFKGSLASRHPLMHRSPPIAGTGAVRLLLCIDEGIAPDAPATPR
jgi:hypothetical protein